MNIGIDVQARCGQFSGLGVYTHHLVSALLRERQNGYTFHLFYKPQVKEWNTFERLVWENIEMPRQAKKAGVRVLHVPAFTPPLKKPCKIVMTVHDLIGKLFPNQLGWPSWWYWSKWLPQAVRRADAIIADTHHTKRDLIQYLGISEQKITVIYPSGHEGFVPHVDSGRLNAVKQKFGIRSKYFLSVGTLEPRKNIAGAVQAFAELRQSEQKILNDYQLALVGSQSFAHGNFFQRLFAGDKRLVEAVVFPGYVTHKELNILYAGAEALVFPSLYEGFGFPVLEAMASGAPVITSATTSLPEVTGDAALLVDPCNVEAVKQAMLAIAQDALLRQKLIAKGFERTKHFSWRKTARETLAVYESLL